MWRLILLALGQSALMVACQLLQKIALNRAGDFVWSWGWFCRFFANFYMIGSGLCFAATAFCWLYMLKRYPFSMVYPMLSLAYVMGMLAAVVFFHEQIPLTRWIGIALIMAGCVLFAK